MRTASTTFDDSCFDHESGRGPQHLVLLPGLVPDGRETFLRQHALFRAHGDVTTVTWPYASFDLDQVVEGVERRVRAIAARGERPVLVGVSVGGGVTLELLRRTAADPLPLAGLLLISPLTCAEDLAPMLRRYIEPILVPTAGSTSAEALEKARGFFRTLAARSMGEPLRSPWKALLTPQGWIQLRDQRVRERIEATLAGIPTAGGLERVHAIQRLTGIHQVRGALTAAQTLIAWGSRERHTVRMDGPGAGLLCRPDLAHRLFPEAEIQWIYDANGGDVPHASLLKHAHAFNPTIKRFLKRLARGAARPLAEAV